MQKFFKNYSRSSIFKDSENREAVGLVFIGNQRGFIDKKKCRTQSQQSMDKFRPIVSGIF